MLSEIGTTQELDHGKDFGPRMKGPFGESWRYGENIATIGDVA